MDKVTDKVKFKNAFMGLISNIDNMNKLQEANRRLLAGFVSKLIEKEVFTPGEVQTIEAEVVAAMTPVVKPESEPKRVKPKRKRRSK